LLWHKFIWLLVGILFFCYTCSTFCLVQLYSVAQNCWRRGRISIKQCFVEEQIMCALWIPLIHSTVFVAAAVWNCWYWCPFFLLFPIVKVTCQLHGLPLIILSSVGKKYCIRLWCITSVPLHGIRCAANFY
jgi:hypothetical protein